MSNSNILDPYTISKVFSYLPTSTSYTLLSEFKNKQLSKIIYYNCLKSVSYLFYVHENGPKIMSIPSNKQLTYKSIPNINFETYDCQSLNNFAVFYKDSEIAMKVFQFQPFKFKEIFYREDIHEIQLYPINIYSFYILINLKTLYLVKDLEVSRVIELSEGFFYRPILILIENLLFSSSRGEQLIVQDLNNNNSKNNTYSYLFNKSISYYIIRKDLIVFDVAEIIEYDFGSSLVVNKETEKNKGIFKMTLEYEDYNPRNSTISNSISFKFIDYLPHTTVPEIFHQDEGSFYCRDYNEKMIYFYKESTLLGKYQLKEDQLTDIIKLNPSQLLICYTRDCDVVNFYNCSIAHRINLVEKNPLIKLNANIEKFGDYFHQTYIKKNNDLGEWKDCILNQNFEKIIEIDSQNYILFHSTSC